MAVPPRTATAGTFFLTAITANRRRLFQVEANARLLLDTLQHYRRQGLYKLHAFVVMPDHLHLLLTTEDLPKAMQHIRGGFSHRLASKRDVWQRGYTDHHILSRDDLEVRRTYIHQNPVRAGLAAHAEDFPYSSVFRSIKDGETSRRHSESHAFPTAQAIYFDNEPPCGIHQRRSSTVRRRRRDVAPAQRRIAQ